MSLDPAIAACRPTGEAAWDRELTVITPTRGWRTLNVKEFFARSELLRFLVWRDLKVRYQQTLLGGLWAIIQPLATCAAFTVVFGRLAGVPSNGKPYPLFSLAGLIVWTYFAGALNAAVGSLVANRRLVSKVYFPRLILPLSAALGGLVDLAIGLACMFAAMLFYGAPLSWTAIYTLPLGLMAMLMATGIGAGLGAINVRFRDVRVTMPLLVQLWLFLTPVAYPASLAPANIRPFLALNPMTGVVEGFRWALLRGGPPPIELMLISGFSGLALGVAGLIIFRKMEGVLADII